MLGLCSRSYSRPNLIIWHDMLMHRVGLREGPDGQEAVPHARTYNRPEGAGTGEIAGLMIDDNPLENARGGVLFRTTGGLHRIGDCDPRYHHLRYPLLFPLGKPDGWHNGLRLQRGGSHKLSCLNWAAFMLQYRPTNGSAHIMMAGKLLQEFAVDLHCQIEQHRLNWVKREQTKLRADLYRGLADAVEAGDANPQQLGKRTVLPSSHTGSPRYMQQNFQDAMAICKKLGKPDLFITFTCNPNWPEIQDRLLPDQEANDRPDLLARVFDLKKKALMHKICKEQVLGQVIGQVGHVMMLKSFFTDLKFATAVGACHRVPEKGAPPCSHPSLAPPH